MAKVKHWVGERHHRHVTLQLKYTACHFNLHSRYPFCHLSWASFFRRVLVQGHGFRMQRHSRNASWRTSCHTHPRLQYIRLNIKVFWEIGYKQHNDKPWSCLAYSVHLRLCLGVLSWRLLCRASPFPLWNSVRAFHGENTPILFMYHTYSITSFRRVAKLNPLFTFVKTCQIYIH